MNVRVLSLQDVKYKWECNLKKKITCKRYAELKSCCACETNQAEYTLIVLLDILSYSAVVTFILVR